MKIFKESIAVMLDMREDYPTLTWRWCNYPTKELLVVSIDYTGILKFSEKQFIESIVKDLYAWRKLCQK